MTSRPDQPSWALAAVAEYLGVASEILGRPEICVVSESCQDPRHLVSLATA
ncbi:MULTISPECIES: hypothetical protein [Rhodococcus]|uniref:hypothetical protein n=1 Tax=Rhodococcus TaxID=1827 RepID=UPI001783D57F|nr:MULTISPECIES: hypothetical protein [Rhodococcus]MCJ0950510.1 hypothetical protein [Rhodococcus sp. ARC_M8]MCQ4152461.1 hypothetical protein [Rhodococcus qingshengii]MDJ0441616.1 hypothetical protein [Rhodococcus qingshengii]